MGKIPFGARSATLDLGCPEEGIVKIKDFEGVKPRRSISHNGGSIKFKDNSAESAILRALLSSSWDDGDIRGEGEKENMPSPTAVHPKIRWNTLCDKICKEVKKVQKEQGMGEEGIAVVRDQDNPLSPSCWRSNEQTETQAAVITLKATNSHEMNCCSDSHCSVDAGARTTEEDAHFKAKKNLQGIHESSVKSTVAGINLEYRETSDSEIIGEREDNATCAEISHGGKTESTAGVSEQRNICSSEDISTIYQPARNDGQDNHSAPKLSIELFPTGESSTEPGLYKTKEPSLEAEKSKTSQREKLQDGQGKDCAEATGSCDSKPSQFKKGVKKANPVPPPPPLLRRTRKTGGADIVREPQVIEMFHELRRSCLNQGGIRTGRQFAASSGSGTGGMSSLLSEISMKSGYAQSIRDDVVKYDKIIRDLIDSITNLKPSNMDMLLEFVKTTDCFLDGLSDETAVLKSFNWPKKYYIFREAKVLYSELVELRKRLEEWGRLMPCCVVDELKEMRNFMGKCVKRIDEVLTIADSEEKKFRDAGIPWKSSIVKGVKQASLVLLEKYMRLTREEVQRIEICEETNDQKCLELLTGAVNFSFKVHQFAGGFTKACSSLFEDICKKTRALITPHVI